MMYRNPWSGLNDSPVDYTMPARDIIACACSHATNGLAGKLRIEDREIADAIADAAYIRAVKTIKQWDTNYPLYNHCWNCVRSVYPEILRKHNASHTEHLDTYDDVASAMPSYVNGKEKDDKEEFEEMVAEATTSGITPMYSSYVEYMKQMKADAIRKVIRRS